MHDLTIKDAQINVDDIQCVRNVCGRFTSMPWSN